MLTAGLCMSPFNDDTTGCVVRCWGRNSALVPFSRGRVDVWLDREVSHSFGWSAKYPAELKPQGSITTMAGGGEDTLGPLADDGTYQVGGRLGTAGFIDGPQNVALFNNPRGLAVDEDRNVCVSPASRLSHMARA